MTIFLYEGVELRNDYSIVFDTSENYWGVQQYTPFHRYLATKTYYEVELPETYFSNSGTITVDWEVWRQVPQGITYMRIVTGTPETRIKYFFVDSYEYANGMLRLSYTLDVWHTYSEVMTIHDGVISQARYGLDGLRHYLPLEYTTNQDLTFRGLNDTKMYIVMEYSLFFQGSLDNDADTTTSTRRENRCSIIAKQSLTRNSQDTPNISAATQLPADSQFTYSLSEAADVINTLTSYQHVKPLGSDKSLLRDWNPSEGDLDETYLVFDKLDIYDRELTAEITEGYWSGRVDSILKKLRYEVIQFHLIPQNAFVPDGIFATAVNSPLKSSFMMATTSSLSQDSVYTTEFERYMMLEKLAH